jgi:hypothetical protein
MLGKHTISPRQETFLKITFNTTGFPGPFRKTATLTTDTPGQAETEVTITGTVREAAAAKIKVTPRRIVLGGVTAGTVTRQKITITNTGTLPLAITRIYLKSTGVPLPEASVDGPVLIEPGKGRIIEFTLVADKPAGQYQDFIVLESNAKNAAQGGYMIMIRNDGG